MDSSPKNKKLSSFTHPYATFVKLCKPNHIRIHLLPLYGQKKTIRDISQNIFHVQQKKEIRIGLEQLEGE